MKRKDLFNPGENGFTLIEMLLVIVLIGILVLFMTPSFVSYKNSQESQQAALNIASMIQTAKSYAQSQLVTSDCPTPPNLIGYSVSIDNSTGKYTLIENCGGVSYTIGRSQQLPTGYSFDASYSIMYAVVSGNVALKKGINPVSSITIKITGSGPIRKVKVDGNGNVTTS